MCRLYCSTSEDRWLPLLWLWHWGGLRDGCDALSNGVRTAAQCSSHVQPWLHARTGSWHEAGMRLWRWDGSTLVRAAGWLKLRSIVITTQIWTLIDGSGEIYCPAVPTMLPRQKITPETFTFPENLQTEANIMAEKVICQWGTVLTKGRSVSPLLEISSSYMFYVTIRNVSFTNRYLLINTKWFAKSF